MIEAKLIDTDKVLDRLQQLPNEPFNNKNKVIQKGLRVAARSVLAYARTNLKKRTKQHTGNLYKAMTYKLKRRKLGALVGESSGAQNHSHLIDQGTDERYYAGKRRGRGPATRFLEDAVNLNAGKIENSVYQAIDDAILKAINR